MTYCPNCGKDSFNPHHCGSCGYPIEDTPKRYLDSLYAEQRKQLENQENYRGKKDGELKSAAMIRKWGELAMQTGKLIQLSRDNPEEFAELANIWYRREKFGLH
jgi:ribosomal protein L37E